MKRAAIAAIAIVASGAAALPVLADANHGQGGERAGPRAGLAQPGQSGMMGYDMMGRGMMNGGMGEMMRMMQMMHGKRAGMMGGGMMGAGMAGPTGPMMGGAEHLARLLDADGDGAVSPDEFRTGMTAELAEYDADGDGTLSLAEFETMHAAHIRETTVDRFQAFDADGDGQVTADEIAAPADRIERMMRIRAAADDATMPMSGETERGNMMDGNGDTMNGNMMDGN